MANDDSMPAADRYAAGRPATHGGSLHASRYLTMRDGVQLAIDVYLPAEGAAFPAIVRQTRYFRATEAGWLGRLIGEARLDLNASMRAFFVQRGYAWIDVDVRGSGASFGVWHAPWAQPEVEDGREVVDWIVAQPWSNGLVGSTGNSYDGTAAELLASTGHPALRAIAPRCSLFDVYTDIAYPGGLRLQWFTEAWTRANQALDANRPAPAIAGVFAQAYPALAAGPPRRVLEFLLRRMFRRVRAVGGDHAAVARAILVRDANLDVDAMSRLVEFRDDLQPLAGEPRSVDWFSPSTYVDRVRDSGVAVLGISGWFDGAYPHAAIKRHLTLAHPRHRLVLGPWNHGVGMTMSPHADRRAARFSLATELLRFFDHHLLGRETGIEDEAPVRYFAMGAERWRHADRWPPATVTPRTLYLGDDRMLRARPPVLADQSDPLVHDPTTGSGPRSRWRGLISPFAIADYPDRQARDRALLCYRSEPLDVPLEIAGHVTVCLFLRATAGDGALFAYLEDETVNGRVHYVTEGQLRLLHGRDDRGSRLYTSPAPYRSFRREDARTLAAGTVTRVELDLLPVAYQFAPGSRLRLVLATADADHFAAVPDAAHSYQIERTAAHPSMIVLPVAYS
jgi:putative CocE/NonD family hydrolase